jgi:hypothetical protein
MKHPHEHTVMVILSCLHTRSYPRGGGAGLLRPMRRLQRCGGGATQLRGPLPGLPLRESGGKRAHHRGDLSGAALPPPTRASRRTL